MLAPSSLGAIHFFQFCLNCRGFDSSFLGSLGNEFQTEMMRLKIETFLTFETAKKLKDKTFDMRHSIMNIIEKKMGLSPRAGNSFISHVHRNILAFFFQFSEIVLQDPSKNLARIVWNCKNFARNV